MVDMKVTCMQRLFGFGFGSRSAKDQLGRLRGKEDKRSTIKRMALTVEKGATGREEKREDRQRRRAR